MMLGPLLLKDLKDFMAAKVRSLYSEVKYVSLTILLLCCTVVQHWYLVWSSSFLACAPSCGRWPQRVKGAEVGIC